jgi:hypothetical protein
MTGSLLTLVREKQAEATREVLDHYRLPRLKPERARLARELSQLIAEHSAQCADDGGMVRRLIQEAENQSPEQVDRINDFLQRYLGRVIDAARTLRNLADKLREAGYPVKGVKSLATIITERESWREDLPEQLAMASRPIRSALRERVAQALQTPPQGTDWRCMFK